VEATVYSPVDDRVDPVVGLVARDSWQSNWRVACSQNSPDAFMGFRTRRAQVAITLDLYLNSIVGSQDDLNIAIVMIQWLLQIGGVALVTGRRGDR
jgi:hypothetical protein